MIQVVLANVILFFCFLLLPIESFSYDSDTVHPLINEHSVRQSRSLSDVLKNMGFNNGVDSIVSNKEIFRWFREGGIKEDETDCRSKFHFHDPTKSWDMAGLSNVAIDTLCVDYRHRSSLVWAQDSNNLWTWQRARQYYSDALTSYKKDLREKGLANTFRALGQLMHLVSDSSVPAHVRNDIHIFPYTIPKIDVTVGDATFESWAKENYRNLNYTGKVIDLSILGQAVFNPSAPTAISALWDQDKYIGTNPDITIKSVVGLAEYSNANLFSEDTIFSDFPFPAWASVLEYDEVIDSTSGKARTYLKKVGDGETINHLAAGKLFYKYLPSFLKPNGLKLDEKVYKDYAALLIPRAVGYSAALLDYFFRGALEITAPDSYVYSIIDGGITPQEFTKIKAKVRNATPNEVIQGCDSAKKNCILQAVARYKKIPDYSADLSKYPPDGKVMQGVEFSYSISAPIIITSLSSTTFTEFTFDFSGSPIPAGITDLYLQVVFKGTLGKEENIAVAVGMKDLMEPTHNVFWNLTDMFSLNYQDSYHLYTATQIEGDSSLATLVDHDHDGIFNEIDIGESYIDPYDLIFDIGYMDDPTSSTVPSLAAVTLPPGKFVRLIVLVDKPTNYLRLTWTQGFRPGSDYSNAAFAGAVNQETGGVWQTPPPSETFRSIRQHSYVGVLECEPLEIDPATGQHVCPYPESEAIPTDMTSYEPIMINFH